MNLQGKKVFTGRMQLVNGWELRPFAIKNDEGVYLPGVSARKHSAGEALAKVLAFDLRCLNREEAFDLALSQGRGLVCGS